MKDLPALDRKSYRRGVLTLGVAAAAGALAGLIGGRDKTRADHGELNVFVEVNDVPAIHGESTRDGPGVLGTCARGAGVAGSSDTGPGVYGEGRVGVKGFSENAEGVLGESQGSAGVRGVGFLDTPGIVGFSHHSEGVLGRSDDGCGVSGSSIRGPGVRGSSPDSQGIVGESDHAAGVRGASITGFGVEGESHKVAGVLGTSDMGPGVRGQSIENDGVLGTSGEGTGVRGLSTNGTGVAAVSDNGLALDVDGKAHFSSAGTDTIAAGTSSKTVTLSGAISAASIVLVTLLNNPAPRRLNFVERAANQFTVHLSGSALTPVSFGYLVIN